MGFGSETLNDIAGFYSAPGDATLDAKAAALHARFRLLEDHLGKGPWFAGERFSLVDAVFAPVFRYFDTFERIGEFGFFDGLATVPAWRAALAARPTVRDAVAGGYGDRLAEFETFLGLGQQNDHVGMAIGRDRSETEKHAVDLGFGQKRVLQLFQASENS